MSTFAQANVTGNPLTIDLATNTASFTGNATLAGSGFDEAALLLLDPATFTAVFGSDSTTPQSPGTPPRSLEQLETAGVITTADVLTEQMDVSGSFLVSAPFPSGQDANVFAFAFGEGVTVPEPATMALLGSGLLGLGLARRRR